MIWKSSEEMTEAPVKPTVQKKVLVQGFQAKFLALVEPTVHQCNDASKLSRGREMFNS
jgi:hypothetical protein